MIDKAPRIHTDRLILRGVNSDDNEPLAAIRAKEEVGKHVGGVRDSQDTWFMMMRMAGMWPLLGYGYWCVDLKETGELIGEVGFADFKRGMQPDISGIPEAGWVLDSSYWGHGLATEAVMAAHHWLDTETEYVQSCCIIDPEHTPSINVAKKCGYEAITLSEYRGDASMIFRRSRVRASIRK